MKAAVWHGGQDIRIEDIPKPEIENNEALVRVKSAGICGSELHAYEGISERRKPPLIMGHEFSGEITEVGRDIRYLVEGDRVAVDPVIRCGTCDQCLRGRGNVCRNLTLIGLHTRGAFAEYVAVPAANCHKLPDNVAFEEGSMGEPVSVAVHAVNRTPIKLGDTVAVVGAGVIGLTVLQAAKLAGAAKVFVIDILDYRLDLARSLGADLTVNTQVEDAVDRIMGETEGLGVDVALEAVGLEVTVRQAMRMATTGGKLTIIGNLARMMELNVQDAVLRELEIKGSYCYAPTDFRRAISLIGDRKIDVKSLITNVLPLCEARKGFELLQKKTEKVLKVLLKP